MRRTVSFLALISSLTAGAHVINFEFVAPDGVGQRTDAGFTTVQWVDSFDANDTSSVLLRAQRSGLSPFTAPVTDAKIREGAIKISDSANLEPWDTRGLEPGCYQPFGVVTDTIELSTVVYPAKGVISVGNVPAIWVLNPREQGFDDAGVFVLRMRVDSENPTRLTVRSANGAGQVTELAAGLPFTSGITTYSLSRSRFEGDSAFVQVEASLVDGGFPCAVWWPGFLTITHDAGLAPDAGGVTPDGGSVPSAPAPGGCGCQSTGAGPAAVALMFLTRRRRRRPVADPVQLLSAHTGHPRARP